MLNGVVGVGYLVSILLGAWIASRASLMPPVWLLGLLVILAGLLIWKAKAVAYFGLVLETRAKNTKLTRNTEQDFNLDLSADQAGREKLTTPTQLSSTEQEALASLMPTACTLLACFVLGFSILLLRAHISLHQSWPSALDGRSLIVHIEPQTQIQTGERAWRFLAVVKKANFVGGQTVSPTLWPQVIGAKVRLNLYFSGAKRYLETHSEVPGEKAEQQEATNSGQGQFVQYTPPQYAFPQYVPPQKTIASAKPYNNFNYLIPAQLQNILQLNPGRTIIAEVKLRSPRGSHNFSAADYQARMLSQSISASGYIKKIISISGTNSFSQPMQLGQYIDRQSLNHGALIKGLLLGDRSDLTRDHWSLLQQTGTGHLLAISGLHIGLSAGIGLLLFGLLGRMAQLIFIKVPAAQTWALVGGGLSALAYAYLADFSLPTQRALVMLWVYLLAALSGHVVSPWRVFVVALLTLLMIDPWALEQAGGCLSFAAVAALIYGYWGRVEKDQTRIEQQRKDQAGIAQALGLFTRLKHYGWQLLRSQVLIASFLTAVLFSLQLPSGALSMPANMLAIPWLSIIIMPILLLFCVAWFLGVSAPWLLSWADFALDILLNYLRSLLKVYDQFNVVQHDDAGSLLALWWPTIEFGALSLLLMLLFAVLLWLPKGLHGRLLALIPLLVLLLPSSALRSGPGALQITILDVGQGLAVLLKKGSGAVLYDTGPSFSAEHNAGASVVAPFLRAQGLRSLDHLIVSHGDTDHSGGLTSLLAQYRVGTLWSEPDFLNKLLLNKHVSSQRSSNKQPANIRSAKNLKACIAGHVWYWQDLKFQWLWPGPEPPEKAVAKRDNNRSCVLLVSYHNVRILLPGDIEKWAEKEILKNRAVIQSAAGLCHIDLMLLPHHGSHSSSHKAWANCTKPAVVISSSAWRNQFGHPSPKVLRRYPSSLQFDTGRDGAIQLHYEPVSHESIPPESMSHESVPLESMPLESLSHESVLLESRLGQRRLGDTHEPQIQLSQVRLSRQQRKRYWHR